MTSNEDELLRAAADMELRTAVAASKERLLAQVFPQVFSQEVQAASARPQPPPPRPHQEMIEATNSQMRILRLMRSLSVACAQGIQDFGHVSGSTNIIDALRKIQHHAEFLDRTLEGIEPFILYPKIKLTHQGTEEGDLS